MILLVSCILDSIRNISVLHIVYFSLQFFEREVVRIILHVW